MREKDLLLLRNKLEQIKKMGWVKNKRHGNAGGVGNTLEDLLEVAENNLEIPDFGEWELKCQRANTKSLLTLLHFEPEPREARIVPQILLPNYGWPHKGAGIKYSENERSFRQTINAIGYSDRGFGVKVDHVMKRIYITFDFGSIDGRHSQWRSVIKNTIGTSDINPKPYWSFTEIEKKLNSKLNNLMYIRAETKTVDGEEFFKYNKLEAYVDPTINKFIDLVEAGDIFVDFDARTGHNHGTKFRIRSVKAGELYHEHIIV
jgi:hypothetical protein